MNQLSNVSLYDVKAYVRKAQNAVLNFSDMEAKVREATNNEPWGTPTSIMQQIADATNNYQQFHEIMPFVFRRFTEKSASEWRQIYKALTLLDYLVRNGSERVVDYARSHISVVEMLRHFGYIDSKGVDQGASIRKRSEELVQLLNSVEKLRAERKKAKQLLAKTGAGTAATSSTSRYSSASFNQPNLSGNSGFGGSGRKYGGISSDQYRAMQFGGSQSQQVYGDGGGFDGSNHIVTGPAHTGDFEEYEVESAAAPSSAPAKLVAEDDDDEFADFQSAPSVETPATGKSQTASILDLFDMPASTSTTSTTHTPGSTTTVTSGTIGNSHFTASSTNMVAAPTTVPNTAAVPNTVAGAPSTSASAAPKYDLFDSLWETSKSNIGKPAIEPSRPASKPASKSAPAPATSVPEPAAAGSSQTSASKPEIEDLLSF